MTIVPPQTRRDRKIMPATQRYEWLAALLCFVSESAARLLGFSAVAVHQHNNSAARKQALGRAWEV